MTNNWNDDVRNSLYTLVSGGQAGLSGFATLSGFTVAPRPIILATGTTSSLSGLKVVVQSGLGVIVDVVVSVSSGLNIILQSGAPVSVDSGLSVFVDKNSLSGLQVVGDIDVVVSSGLNVTIQSGLGVISNVVGDSKSYLASIKQGIPILYHPFGKGNLTTNGTQYSTEVLNSGDKTTYQSIESVTINKEAGSIQEIEFGLTGAVHTNSSVASINWKWQGSDDGSAWVDLHSAQTTSSSTYVDVSIGGRFAPVSGFYVSGTSFVVRMVEAIATSGIETIYGKTKNNSYVSYQY